MIVDDHPSFRELLRVALQPLGVKVVECADGREAVERYAETLPDCVLMDVEMKGLDGFGATALIRERFPQARIVILTQHNDPEFQAAARETGVCDYLLKEDLSQLTPTLARLMGLSPPGSTGGAGFSPLSLLAGGAGDPLLGKEPLP